MDRLTRLLESEEEKYITQQVDWQLTREIEPLLTTREWFVIRHYFGIGVPRKSMRQLGKQMDVTRQRIWQIKRDAINILREKWRHDHPYTIPENMGPGGCTGIILMDEES